ncbi:MAG: NAD(P)-dependent oxidoreductase [Eubacteriales bacterium]|nr:NAD(P)-dependent oxidoreductase [Eubacteriales bacterium]
MKIAWIGTGVMGTAMARHLAEAGHEVRVYNRTPSKAEALEPICKAVTSIAEALEGAEACFSIVGFVADVEDVYFREAGILDSAPKGCLLCDMTTSSPALARRIAEAAEARGLESFDAPVTGGDRGAREARLSIMVGGSKSGFEKLRPLLVPMAQAINYMGEAGTGQEMKLANQMAIGATISGLAEALSFAKQKGLDLNQVLDVINNGSAASWQSANMGPKMIAGDYVPGFFVKHLIKDLRLGQENSGDLDLPVSRSALEQYLKLEAAGFGESGTQAIIEAYRDNEEA